MKKIIELKDILPKDAIIADDYIFFLRGWLSQWYKSEMNDGVVKYCCCEQYMMYHKACLFMDNETARKILESKKPSEHKMLGRQVKNFQEHIWNDYKFNVVYNGNYLKFSQNDELKKMLIATNPYQLAEANGEDRIWGIGKFADDSNLMNKDEWGENLLGKVLVKVREQMLKTTEGN